MLDLSAPFTKTTLGVATNPDPDAGACSTSRYVTRIVPGDRDASLVWHKVNNTQDCGKLMPSQTGAKHLDATELERFGLWIDGLPKSD